MAKKRDECSNTCSIGEHVIYCDGTGVETIATVVNVIFWDVIDIELPDGRLVFGVRRVIGDHALSEPTDCSTPENFGKFRRMT